jgi:hypothetical protein
MTSQLHLMFKDCKAMKYHFFKSLFFLSVFFSMPVVASAQFSVALIGGSMWIGVRAGANLASESFDSIPLNASTGMKTGLIGGISLEYWLDNNWAVSSGIVFDQKGTDEQYSSNASNREVGNTIYSGTDDFSLNYLEIPILLKYALGVGVIRPYICAGPSLGELLSASETVSGNIEQLSNFKSDLQSTDISIYAALGLMDQVYHGPILLFEAGYASGVTSIYKSTPARTATDGTNFPDPITPASVKSGDIRITIAAMWPL